MSLSRNIGNRILRKKKKSLSRNKSLQTFDTARKATIIFDAMLKDCFPPVKEFSKYLVNKGIKTKVIGFVNQKEVPHEMLLWSNFDFITRQDINWYGKPKGDIANEFFRDEPDILFVFSFTEQLPISFLTQLSLSRFKVGCFTESENDFDLMISPPDGNCEVQFFVEQVKHYINMLNPS